MLPSIAAEPTDDFSVSVSETKAHRLLADTGTELEHGRDPRHRHADLGDGVRLRLTPSSLGGVRASVTGPAGAVRRVIGA